MSDTKTIIDCATGEVTQVPLTPEEVAFRESLTSLPDPEPIEAIAADLPAVTLDEANDLMARLVAALTDRGIV
jgi:hypothetical protein